MAKVDFSTTDAQQQQMMTVMTAIRAKLNPLRGPLQRMMKDKENKAKIVALLQTDNGRFLREIRRFYEDLDDFMQDIGYWR